MLDISSRMTRFPRRWILPRPRARRGRHFPECRRPCSRTPERWAKCSQQLHTCPSASPNWSLNIPRSVPASPPPKSYTSLGQAEQMPIRNGRFSKARSYLLGSRSCACWEERRQRSRLQHPMLPVPATPAESTIRYASCTPNHLVKYGTHVGTRTALPKNIEPSTLEPKGY